MKPIALRCPQCGGDLQVDEGQALCCTFCDHQDSLLEVNALVPVEERLQLPARVSEKQARSTLGIECDVPDTPSSDQVWVPFWVLDIRAEAHYGYRNKVETLTGTDIEVGRDVLLLPDKDCWGAAARIFGDGEWATICQADLSWSGTEKFASPPQQTLQAVFQPEKCYGFLQRGFETRVRPRLSRKFDELTSLEVRLKFDKTRLIYRPLWRFQGDSRAWIDASDGRLLYSSYPESGLRRWIKRGLAIPSRLKEMVLG